MYGIKERRDVIMTTDQLVDLVESRIKELAVKTREAKSAREVVEYLRFMGQFHQYSLNNTMSIWMHSPQATQVAGYKAWTKLRRYVKPREKGIPILAPCTQVIIEIDEHGQEKRTHRVVGYKVVHVFDVSQTEGEPLPEAPIVAKGDGRQLLPVIESVAADLGIELEYKELSASHHGTSYGGRIEVDTRMDEAGRASVILHELAHELLHKGSDRKLMSVEQRETEAESTAYVVCVHFGIESAAQNYLALWEIPEERIVESFQRIRGVALSLIGMIEAKLNAEEV